MLTASLGDGEVLEVGMVLSVEDGPHRDVVLVTGEDPEVLSGGLCQAGGESTNL